MTRYWGYMTYIGAAAVLLAVFMAWRCYCDFLFDELSHTRAFLRALQNYRERMKCYLESPSGWASGYDDALLSSSGFLDMVSGGESFSGAYLKTRELWCVSPCVDEILDGCFSRLGEGYLETELEVIESAISDIEREEKRLAEDISRRKRVAGALLGAFAVGVVILAV